jgi:hypothetical protein
MIVAAGYAAYAFDRNLQGHSTSPKSYNHALANARHVVRAERATGLYQELHIQHAAMHSAWLLRGLDTFWATAHFAVTAAVIVWLIRWQPQRYPRLRTVLAVTTALALVIFAVYPVLPPRLMPPGYGFIDTWQHFGGIGSAHPPRIERISDPFAAMPSLHLAWAAWCALAVAPVFRSRWAKAAVWSYPVMTFIAVLATGNHFILDTIAGVLILAAGVAAAAVAERLKGRGRSAGGLLPAGDDRWIEPTPAVLASSPAR